MVNKNTIVGMDNRLPRIFVYGNNELQYTLLADI